jgi:hypothetical protein
MPPGYVSPPELLPIAAFFWDAFSILSSARPIGMGVGPIPFPAVAQFAELYGITNIDGFETLREIVDKLDNEYLRLNQPDTETTGSVMQRVKARAAAKFGEVEE